VIRHGGLIARFDGGRWKGVLIEGDSGSGKSDLALRAISAGWVLIADDRTLVWTSRGRLYGRAPDSLVGLIEARGLGVLDIPRRDLAQIVLAVRCMDAAALERTPDPTTTRVLGVTLPLVALAALEPSAPAKLDRALERIGLQRQQAYQAARAGGVLAGRGRGPVRFPK
jgi:serine kinase of HPr protein (carbohydrate metabolism regulator)